MKLNKYQVEFIDNTIKINEILFNLSDKEIKKLFALHKEQRDKLLQSIASIILEYKVTNEFMNLSNEEKKILNEKLGNEINESFKEQNKIEKQEMDSLLKKIAEDKFYMNCFNLALGIDFTLKKIDSKALDRIIKDTVEGKNYSDRLWRNKNDLSKLLRKEIKEFLEGKTSINEISKIVKDRFNQNSFNSKRLINNETARVQSEVNEQWAKDYDIGYQLFMATLDQKTSEICRRLDGNVYSIDDKNKPIPPTGTHVCCRSCLISIPSTKWRPKKRMDNETKDHISYKKYEEWKKDNNI
ncbi:minor capsid protein [uncultured Clostridium sp.]|jgi:SPP1 gp7 family putative phage head morphogenesis protein|uniref:minor capsid protein n=1 Tax=uncultured Clostridium sp. TaxID=59620 RepID=UPI00204825BC|nr:minor capsid protein [uncultured Clostridium sp.]DAV65675.1 MAG TPA: minor capsid protein [Caudoviricetes sp.]